jgi:hypothetical protein
MYKLLRNYGDNVPPPTQDWGKEPKVGQKTIGDDIERIRKYRNLKAHDDLPENIDDDDFKFYWEELAQVIILLWYCEYCKITCIHVRRNITRFTRALSSQIIIIITFSTIKCCILSFE